MKENFIYVLSCFDAVKVGKTNNVENRVKNHKSSNPFISLVAVYELPEWCEHYIHHKLKEHLITDCTEWFKFHTNIYIDIENIVSELKNQILIGEQKNKNNKIRYNTIIEKSEQLLTEMFNLGMSNVAIAKKFGVSEKAIRNRLKKINLKRKTTKDDLEFILDSKNNGLSNIKIAELLNVTEGCIRKILKKYA